MVKKEFWLVTNKSEKNGENSEGNAHASGAHVSERQGSDDHC